MGALAEAWPVVPLVELGDVVEGLAAGEVFDLSVVPELGGLDGLDDVACVTAGTPISSRASPKTTARRRCCMGLLLV